MKHRQQGGQFLEQWWVSNSTVFYAAYQLKYLIHKELVFHQQAVRRFFHVMFQCRLAEEDSSTLVARVLTASVAQNILLLALGAFLHLPPIGRFWFIFLIIMLAYRLLVHSLVLCTKQLLTQSALGAIFLFAFSMTLRDFFMWDMFWGFSILSSNCVWRTASMNEKIALQLEVALTECTRVVFGQVMCLVMAT